MRNMWTDEEILYLTTYYKNTKNQELSKVLNKTMNAIKLKAKRLQLRKNEQFTKLLKSENILGNKNPMYGKIGSRKGVEVSQDTRYKLRMANLGRPGLSGSRNPMYGLKAWNNGIPQTDEVKLKLSKLQKLRWSNFTPEKRLKFLQQLSIARSELYNIKYDNKIEKKIKNLLIDLGYEFEQGKPIGFYHCDFVIGDKIIEVQGDYWHGNPLKFSNLNLIQRKNVGRDKAKKTYLTNRNYKILYLWETDINKNTEYIKKTMLNFLNN